MGSPSTAQADYRCPFAVPLVSFMLREVMDVEDGGGEQAHGYRQEKRLKGEILCLYVVGSQDSKRTETGEGDRLAQAPVAEAQGGAE